MIAIANKKTKLFIIIIGLVLLALTIPIQSNIDKIRNQRSQLDELRYLPSGKVLNIISLGYEQVVSDIIWLQTIQIIGEKSKVTDRTLYYLADLATEVDPNYNYIYRNVGQLLFFYDQNDDSIIILEKGMDKLGGEEGLRTITGADGVDDYKGWQIPFYLGLNYFFDKQDYVKAAYYLRMTCRLSNYPSYLPRLAAQLEAEAGNKAFAVNFLNQEYKRTEDEDIKEKIKYKLKYLIIVRDVEILENAMKTYEDSLNQKPTHINQLITFVELPQLNILLDEFNSDFYKELIIYYHQIHNTYPTKTIDLLPLLKPTTLENLFRDPFFNIYYIDNESGAILSKGLEEYNMELLKSIEEAEQIEEDNN